MPVDKNLYLNIISFINGTNNSFPQIKEIVFFFKDHLVWSGLEQEDIRVLYRFLIKILAINNPDPDSIQSDFIAINKYFSPFLFSLSLNLFLYNYLALLFFSPLNPISTWWSSATSSAACTFPPSNSMERNAPRPSSSLLLHLLVIFSLPFSISLLLIFWTIFPCHPSNSFSPLPCVAAFFNQLPLNKHLNDKTKGERRAIF